MQKTLLVCSPSTRKYLPEYDDVFLVKGAPTKNTLTFMNTRDDVVAIGGGAVIDTAKIISSSPITCYPTTAAGSSKTSHSVCWDGTNKLSIKRFIPKKVIVRHEFLKNIPKQIIDYTTYDVISHCLDSLWSKNSNINSQFYALKALSILKGAYTNEDLVRAGNYGGMAIEICPTTILHSISYPLTAYYNIPHGKALGYLLPRVCEYYGFDLKGLIPDPPIILENIDWDFICKESLKYDKIYNTKKEINYKILKKILKKT